MSTSVLSKEEQDNLLRIMEIKYAAQLEGRFFELALQTDDEVAEVKLTLRNLDRSYVYPVEGRILCKEQNLTGLDGTMLLIDAIDAYFEEYLQEDEDIYLALDWKLYQVEGLEFFLRGQVLNLKCEEEADRLLGLLDS